MRRTRVFTVLAAVAVVGVACKDEIINQITGIPAGVEVFTATLNGANERPTATTTTATGTATFTALGNLLSWKVDVAGISNVSAGHIHFGGPNDALGIMVDLTPTTGGTNFTGTISLGSATVADSVLTHMRAGNAYVNVHTSDGVNDAVGPAGDYPGGEIRGQTVKQ